MYSNWHFCCWKEKHPCFDDTVTNAFPVKESACTKWWRPKELKGRMLMTTVARPQLPAHHSICSQPSKFATFIFGIFMNIFPTLFFALIFMHTFYFGTMLKHQRNALGERKMIQYERQIWTAFFLFFTCWREQHLNDTRLLALNIWCRHLIYYATCKMLKKV